MKLNKILIFMVLLLTLALNVNAITYMQGGSDFVDTSYSSCIVQDDTDCRIWKDWFTLDYRDDSSLLKNLMGEGLSSQMISGNYKFFLEYEIYNGSEGKWTGLTDNVSIVCDVDCNNFNCSNQWGIDLDFAESESQELLYEEVNLQNGDFLRCNIYTTYKDHATALSSPRANYRIWQPSYESEQSEPDRRTIINLEAENIDLENQITGEYSSTADYVLSVIQSVVKINYRLWVFLYWVLMIASLMSAFSLLFYVIFWFYQKVKGKK